MAQRKKIIFGIGTALIAGIGFGLYQFLPPQSKAEKERFVVSLSTSESEVIKKLHSQGFIRSPLAFNLVLAFRGWQEKIEPGGYLISKRMSAFELADTLVNHPYQKWAVIPEGLRKEEVAEIVEEKLNWTVPQKEEFLENSQEGYLFPDTYLLNLDYSGEEVAKRMRSRFEEKVADLFLKAGENNIRSDTLIILASLVQREAASEKDMPLISGVIWNRWMGDMPFEIDATVQYALGKLGKWWPRVKPEDYKVESPYNTYLHQGRPPAPICNPGLEAIAAVIFSEETDYLYYLHDENKEIHPARTYEGHLENIDKYLVSPNAGD